MARLLGLGMVLVTVPVLVLVLVPVPVPVPVQPRLLRRRVAVHRRLLVQPALRRWFLPAGCAGPTGPWIRPRLRHGPPPARSPGRQRPWWWCWRCRRCRRLVPGRLLLLVSGYCQPLHLQQRQRRPHRHSRPEPNRPPRTTPAHGQVRGAGARSGAGAAVPVGAETDAPGGWRFKRQGPRPVGRACWVMWGWLEWLGSGIPVHRPLRARVEQIRAGQTRPA